MATLQPTKSQMWVRSTNTTVAAFQLWHQWLTTESTHWQVVVAFGTNGGDGFIIRQLAGADTTSKYLFRRASTNNLEVLVDPAGTVSLVDGSDASIYATPLQLVFIVGTSSGRDEWQFHEWQDYLAIYNVDRSSAICDMPDTIQVGYGITPALLSDPADGLTGQVLIGGDADTSNSSGSMITSSATSPSLAGMQAIFPSHCTKFAADTVQTTNQCPRALCFDDTEGVWLYCTDFAGAAESYVIWGPVLDPSADANEYGTVYVYGSRGTGSERGIGHTQSWVSAFDPGGTLRDYSLSVDNDLDEINYKVIGGAEDGRLNWKKCEVNNGSGGSGIKGHVKEEYIVEIGPYNNGMFFRRAIQFPTAATPVVCYTITCAIFWEDGARFFPSYFNYDPLPYG